VEGGWQLRAGREERRHERISQRGKEDWRAEGCAREMEREGEKERERGGRRSEGGRGEKEGERYREDRSETERDAADTKRQREREKCA